MTKRTQSFVLLAFLVLLMLPGFALADPNGRGPQPPVAELDVATNAIVFHPVTEFKRLSLTVTGPAEYVFEREVNKGELVFELSEETIDGCYTYELRVTPEFDPEILDILRESRETGDRSQVARLRREGKLPSEAHVQAGGFNVIEGRIVLSDDIEKGAFAAFDSDVPPKARKEVFGTGAALMRTDAANAANGIPRKDFVIIDDLIVDGSACIGFDCVNGESFGFDTIRLKENNLRIKFDDTSTAASFPRNDWQLTANDSANGGASKFSIDDISGSRTPFTVEANARSHSLYVDDGGRIGSRTSTPSTEIHTIDGDTPTLRLQQDGSSGFAPQTWDVAGNETNFFIRDVTNGSQLPFRIRPDAPTSSIFIDVDGDVGLGTSSPSEDLHVHRSSGSANFELETTDAAAVQFNMINQGWEWQLIHGAGGALNVNRVGVAGNQFVFATNGSMTIQGSLIAQGGDGSTDPGDTFPDYVFEDSYELMPIDDLESFVSREKHLPRVMSRSEVSRTGGVNMTKLQLQMLEKLEELTLYTLEQHRRINQLEKLLAEERQKSDTAE